MTRALLFAGVLLLSAFSLQAFSSQADLHSTIVLNEVVYNPRGSEVEGEWIELFNGGESVDAHTYYPIAYTATDDSGISSVNTYLSDDSGMTWKLVAKNEAPGTGYSWFVPNRPGPTSQIRVEAGTGIMDTSRVGAGKEHPDRTSR